MSLLIKVRPQIVLVVAHQPTVQRLLVEGLQAHGYWPIPASSGAEAVHVFPAYVGVVDIAIIDQDIPDLDGLATMTKLLRIKPALRCCLLTNRVPIEREELWSAPSLNFLSSTFSLEALGACLRQLSGEMLVEGEERSPCRVGA